jgi:hypothetical protein
MTPFRAPAEKAEGAFEGVPVVYHPDLKDRVVVVDLAAVHMEERATEGWQRCAV